MEASFKAIKDGKTGYCPNAGIPALRAALADDLNASHGLSCTAEYVAVQPGGKPVIGKFLMALMEPGDEVLYPNPGYPIYSSRSNSMAALPSPTATSRARRGSDRPDALEADDSDAPAGPERAAEPPRRADCSAEEASGLPSWSCGTT